MARIPDAFIDELLSRIDLVELIGRYVPLKRSGANWMGLCPFHREKTPSFSVSSTKQLYYCFGCGKGGSAIRFLMDYEGLSFREAVERLASMAGMRLPEEAEGTRPQEDEKRKAGFALLARAAEAFHRELARAEHAKSYLRLRGLDAKAIQAWQIGYAPKGYGWMARLLGLDAEGMRLAVEVGLCFAGKQGRAPGEMFRNRVMFPIRDRQGRVVGFGGRVLGDEQGAPKYLNTPETPWFQKHRLLFGEFEHREAIRRERVALVVEGYFDVIGLSARGVPLALAPLGTALAEGQLRSLLRMAPQVICCFDGDEAGRRAAWRALQRALPLLRAEHDLRFAFLPAAEDPDSFSKRLGGERFLQWVRKHAMESVAFWLEGLERWASGGVAAKARAAKQADAMLASMQDDYLREAWRSEAERRMGIPLRAQAPGIAGKELRLRRLDPLPARFLAALLQRPQRIASLPEVASEFFSDYAEWSRIYARMLALAREGTNLAARLAMEFPEAEDEIAQLAQEAPVEDAEFSTLAKAMELAYWRRRLMTKRDLGGVRAILAARKRMEELERSLHEGVKHGG